MLKHSLRAAALLAVLSLAGCKRGGPPPLPPGVAPEDTSTRLNEMSSIVVGEWLKFPRAEQAKIADEWAETVQKQLSAIRSNPQSVDLLPKLLPNLTTPVFREAKYSPSIGFSLPPYVVPGKPDGGVALHLARFGDHEAAARFATEDVLEQLPALKAGKNYPVEWTRLVATVQISAQLKLSIADADGAMMLTAIHKQLLDVLDKKAAEGPLGAALLSAGRTALERAAVAWRDKKRNKIGLAEDVENALKDWGSVTAVPALPVGAPQKDVETLFGTAARGKAVFADTPERVARVADLFGLPIPGDGAQSVVAFLDPNGKLAEWQFAYRPKIDTLYTSIGQFAFRLTEAGFASGKDLRTTNLYQQPFTAGGVAVEVTRCSRSLSLGGLVRVTATKDAPVAASIRSLRDFGPVSLDRAYEVNRMALHPPAGGTQITVKDSNVMKKMAKVLDTPTPEAVLLAREKDADAVDLLELVWPAAENNHALDKLLPSLWDDYGPAKLEDIDDQHGTYLAFTWQDKTTRVRLRLPFDDRGPVLSARDVQTDDQNQVRAELARKIDEQDRAARIAEGKTHERLSRSPGRVNELSLGGLKLGQAKWEAEKALPKGKWYKRKDLADGVSIVILSTPEKQATQWAKQLLIRYHENKVAEIRVRYHQGPAKVKKGEPLLQALVDASGAPESLSPTWSDVWGDVANHGKAAYYRWRDDRTVRTYQRDDSGIEVTWLDRLPQSASLDAPPWQFVSDGVPHCKLGDTRQVVETYFKSPATQSDGGEVYRTADSSPYEMVVVWYEGDKVSRVLAVHRARCGPSPNEVVSALNAVWGKDIDHLGAIRRQQGEFGQVLGAYWWHDDKVRVRTAVQSTDQGPRLMTEWRLVGGKANQAKREG